MGFTIPSVTDFKTFFTRDFQYGSTSDVVMDVDVSNAMVEASGTINQGLFGDQSSFTLAFLQLSAHLMVMSLKASSQGLNGGFGFLQNSRGVGSVSESLAIPPRFLDNPMFSYYAKTNYGMKYLMMVWPKLQAQIFTVEDTTLR